MQTCAHLTTDSAERAAGARTLNPHPLKKMVVATMKHCSILALGVVCSAVDRAGKWAPTLRKGAEKENVRHV